MKNNNLRKSIIFVVIIIIVVTIIGILSFYIIDSNSSKNDSNPIKTIDEIKGYNISLRDTANDAYKAEFNKLRENLESGNVNYNEYAESVAKMFIMDLYTINNKVNKYDVGGVEFILPENKDNYILNVSNTLYNYVEDNSKNNRKQSLPEVTDIKINNVEKKKYVIKSTKETYEAYYFNVEISYKNDLGYDKTGEVIVINKNNIMYVVEKN